MKAVMDQHDYDDLIIKLLKRDADLEGLAGLTKTDWDLLVSQAHFSQVAPILYQRLVKENHTHPIPQAVTLQLRDAYYVCLGNNLRLNNALSRLLQQFQAASVPVIVLKGAVLAEIVYGNIGLRPMNDLDILVHKDDLQRSQELLWRAGYQNSSTFDIEEECAKLQHIPAVINSDRMLVEVHWTLVRPDRSSKVDIEGVWQRARRVDLVGTQALVLSPEDLLLHLCVHNSIHHIFMVSLRSFYDVAEVIRFFGSELDWEQFESFARAWQVAKGVYLTLFLAQRWFNASVPSNVMEQLQPPDYDSQAVTWAEQQVFSDENAHPFSKVFSQGWASQGVTGKAGLMMKRFFPSRERLASLFSVPPDSWRIYLYYPINAFIPFKRRWRQIYQMVSGREQISEVVEREDKLLQWMKS